MKLAALIQILLISFIAIAGAIDHLQKALSVILHSFQKNNEKCLLLNMMQNSYHMEDYQTIVYSNINESQKEKLGNAIADENPCTVLIIGGKNNESFTPNTLHCKILFEVNTVELYIISLITYIIDHIELRKRRNTYDVTHILEEYLCPAHLYPIELSHEEIKGINNTFRDYNPENKNLSSIVEIIKGSNNRLAINVGGEPPFLYNGFDSTGPLIHLNDDDAFIYVYMYCPNVTQDSKYRKWSLLNVWSKFKEEFFLPSHIHRISNHCPHTLFNQTLIVGYWNAMFVK